MGSLWLHEPSTCDRHQPSARPAGSIHSRRLHQRTLDRSSPTRTALALQRRPTLAHASLSAIDSSAFAESARGHAARATRLAHLCPLAPSPSRARRSYPQLISPPFGRDGTAAHQRSDPRSFDPNRGPLGTRHRADRRHRFARCLQWIQKKDTGTYTAQHAALGGRTLKTGQSRWFVGYKKHSFRLWWREHSQSVLLVPLVSWVAPANVSEGGLLIPSLHYCDQRWSWWPRQVAADMGYLAAERKRLCRERWHVAVVTHVRSDMKMVAPFQSEREAACAQGSPCNGSATMCATTCIGLEQCRRHHSARFAGKPAPAPESLPTHLPLMKPCSDCCP